MRWHPGVSHLCLGWHPGAFHRPLRWFPGYHLRWQVSHLHLRWHPKVSFQTGVVISHKACQVLQVTIRRGEMQGVLFQLPGMLPVEKTLCCTSTQLGRCWISAGKGASQENRWTSVIIVLCTLQFRPPWLQTPNSNILSNLKDFHLVLLFRNKREVPVCCSCSVCVQYIRSPFGVRNVQSKETVLGVRAVIFSELLEKIIETPCVKLRAEFKICLIWRNFTKYLGGTCMLFRVLFVCKYAGSGNLEYLSARLTHQRCTSWLAMPADYTAPQCQSLLRVKLQN